MRPGWIRPSETSFSSEIRADLAADRVEPGKHHRFGGVVDDDVDPGGLLEGADVPPLASDDAPLHLVGWQGDHRDGGLGGVVGGDALDGEGDDLLGLAVGVPAGLLLDLADPLGGGCTGLLLHGGHQLPARLVGAEAGERLQLLLYLGEAPAQLGGALLHRLLARAGLAGALILRLRLLVEQQELAVERLLPLLDPPLRPLDFVTPPRLLALPLLLRPEPFLLASQDAGLADVLRVLLRGGEDAAALLLGGFASLALPRALRGPAGQRAHGAGNCRRHEGDDESIHVYLHLRGGCDPRAIAEESSMFVGSPPVSGAAVTIGTGTGPERQADRGALRRDRPDPLDSRMRATCCWDGFDHRGT